MLRLAQVVLSGCGDGLAPDDIRACQIVIGALGVLAYTIIWASFDVYADEEKHSK